MISIIKTAIITIIISFISGLLLEHYKNLAPRILCNMGKGRLLNFNNKKICKYILTVRNISNKTIHDITVNVQGSQNNLRIGDSKITKGLKFDSSMKGNILDVHIPFLSKEDEFSVELYVENQGGGYKKPITIIRSPEKFKEVDSVEQKGLLSTLFKIPKNKKKVVPKTMKNNETRISNKKTSMKPSKNKKIMIIVTSIILVIAVGVLGKGYLQKIAANKQTSNTKNDVQKQSNDESESTDRTTKNADEKSSTDGTTRSSGEKSSTDGTTRNSDEKSSTGGTTKNTDAKASTSGTTRNTDAKTSTNETTKNTDAKTSTDETTKNTDAKTSTSGTTENKDTKTTTGGTTENKDTNTTTGGTSENKDTKSSTDGTNTDTKTSTDGTSGTAGN
ncbi:hypothetical protein ACFIJ5_13870 [Haloimpatiens sp. FM7330]|uniref:hypothetical protein n=1 Tax=Haloimpatiens sp. FM7330 TaxID=3298610 RepID=UPI00364180D1